MDLGIEKKENDNKIPLVVIVGPTAVGKTSISIALAKRLKGEIISADSMQVYRYMDIGTAKPRVQERKEVPHHLIDVLDPGEPFNVAEYQRMADDAIRDVYSRGHLPIFVGGTGLYIKAVVDGFLFPDSGKDLKLRETLKHEADSFGNQHLHDKLKAVDAEAAQRIHVNDLRRIIRALEVFYTTGKPISEHQRGWDSHEPRYNSFIIGLTMEREALYERIERRVDDMIREGLINEVKQIFSLGYSERLTSMQALGYKEIIGYLIGEYSLENAIEILKRETRRYAKRQMTWFKRDKRINWASLDKSQNIEEIVDKLLKLIEGNYEYLENIYRYYSS